MSGKRFRGVARDPKLRGNGFAGKGKFPLPFPLPLFTDFYCKAYSVVSSSIIRLDWQVLQLL